MGTERRNDRTEADMKWLQAMFDAGYKFYPNQAIGKDKIWYGDMIYADYNGDGIYGNDDDRRFSRCFLETEILLRLAGKHDMEGL